MFTAIIAAIFGAGGDITNKRLLGELKLPAREYLPFVFLILSIISFFLAPLNFHFDTRALSFGYIVLFLFMVACAAIWNMLLAKSLKSEPLHEYESIILLVPMVTVILASVFLPAERNAGAVIAGLVSSGALLYSRFRNHHFQITKNVRRTALAVLLIALESISLKVLLDFYSPSFLYFIRVLLLAGIFFYYYRPDFKILSVKPVLRGLILSAICGTGVMVLKYYAFSNIGVVKTTIILLLSPVITFAASYYYFGEHRNFRRDMTCAMIVIACIIFSALAG